VETLRLGPAGGERVVLFAAGAGGDPERHRPLLEHLADCGCQVIAPCFERLAAQAAAAPDLVARPAGLAAALRRYAAPEAAVAVVGHSIGGWAALCLAGAIPYGRDGVALEVPREPRVSRLVLFAPAAGWFAAPGALDAVTAPMLVFTGDLDTVTPAEQVACLQQAPAPVDLRTVPGADHFSFMNTRPPGTADPAGLDREAHLQELTRATSEFIICP
jgi:pimeloyl-ACP methyl ester carboxylesterase